MEELAKKEKVPSWLKMVDNFLGWLDARLKENLGRGLYFVIVGSGLLWAASRAYDCVQFSNVPTRMIPLDVLKQEKQPPRVWHMARTNRNDYTFYYQNDPMKLTHREPGQFYSKCREL